MRAIDFNSPSVVRCLLVAVPLLFGGYSVLLGQDANYDLYNYHLYNAFAFLNNKLTIDFAPAGSQSYFNPSLDVVLYWLNIHLPPWIVGFIMGCLHGLNFLLVYAIARKMLVSLPSEDRLRIPLFLALAGSLTANFLSELGSSMGDNTTALFSLSALCLILAYWDRLASWSWRALLVIGVAGVVAGIGIGLKLTNAVYALALCLALLWYPARFVQRVGLIFCFGVAVLLGLALSGGYWFVEMWQTFRNPLFPQFSAYFPNPLTSSITVTDSRWLPTNWLESLLWPILISLKSGRVGEITGIHQYIWAVVYLLLIVMLGKWCYARLRPVPTPRLEVRQRYVVAYVVIGFVIWMKLFSIYRYLVAVELLAPLLVYVLFSVVSSPTWGRKWGARAIGVCTMLVVVGGTSTWGHEGWAKQAFHAELPELTDPAGTMVILPGGDPPLALLASFYPKQVAFAQLYAYPAGPQFSVKMDQMTQQRNQNLYAVFAGNRNSRADSVTSIDAKLSRLGLNGSESGCSKLRWLVDKLHLRMAVGETQVPGRMCQLQLRPSDVVDVQAADLAARDNKRPLFAPYQLKLIDDSCKNYKFGVGSGVKIYQLCKLERLESP